MTHYVCTGNCGGEASKPGVCQAEGCSREDQPLEQCECEDGLHPGVEMQTEEEIDDTSEEE